MKLFCQKPFVFCSKLSIIICYFLSRSVRRRRQSSSATRAEPTVKKYPSPSRFPLLSFQRRFARPKAVQEKSSGVLPRELLPTRSPPNCAANAAKSLALGVQTLQIVIVCILPTTIKTMRHNPRSRNIIRKNKTGEKSKSKLPPPPGFDFAWGQKWAGF